MTKPTTLAKKIIRSMELFENSETYRIDYIERSSKALGLLSAFINEKEFLEEWSIPTDEQFKCRLKELTSAINLLEKNGISSKLVNLYTDSSRDKNGVKI